MVGVNKTDAIRAIVEVVPDHPVVFTTGYSCRIARALTPNPRHFYMTGSMGLAPAIALGLSDSTGTTAVVVDGDGALLMNPTTLIVAGSAPTAKLVHVLLDDGQYASTGGQHTPRPIDFGAWAVAAGYTIKGIATTTELRQALLDALAHCARPVFLHCRLSPVDDPAPPRIGMDLAEHARSFSAAVCSAHLRGRGPLTTTSPCSWLEEN